MLVRLEGHQTGPHETVCKCLDLREIRKQFDTASLSAPPGMNLRFNYPSVAADLFGCSNGLVARILRRCLLRRADRTPQRAVLPDTHEDSYPSFLYLF